MSSNLLKGLNDKQRQAVEVIQGPLLIIAGPGSGKTRVITHRIAYLSSTGDVPPHHIAAVTFTNKAAREVRERLALLMGPSAENVMAGTFHSFCARLLRREGNHLGLDRDFAIYDDSDQMAVIKRAMSELEIDPKQFPPRTILSRISGAKSQLTNVDEFALSNESHFDEIVHRVYEKYDSLIWQSSAIDFDDILFKTYILFEQFPDVLSKYQARYAHLMIDEFQDTNVAQYAIAKQLAGTHRNLCVVGDPDQSIYAWRNADIRNILSFQHDFPEANVITLEENYRSTRTILSAAHNLIQANEQRVKKELWTHNGVGVPITVVERFNDREEAQWVVREIQNLVRDENWSRNDIAVMYRVNAQSLAFEQVCTRYSIPYQLVGSLRFYHRQEIKTVTSYLRLMINPDDDVSFARVVNVPPRNIGQKTMERMTRLAQVNSTSVFTAIGDLSEESAHAIQITQRSLKALQSFRELILNLISELESNGLMEFVNNVIEKTGYEQHILSIEDRREERLENIQELKNQLEDHTNLETRDSLVEFLDNITLTSETDNMDGTTNTITLITLHQAKGLEFPVVFMVGMEEGTLPHIRAMDDESEMEEERRLAYVGVTRAKERLYLTRAFRRGFRGASIPRDPSRFLLDLPSKLIVSPNPSVSKARPVESMINKMPAHAEVTSGTNDKNLPTLVTGDKVNHPKFGEGIVTSTKVSTNDLEITVAFKDGAGIKRLLLSLAKLEKVG
jgi:DNA helicase-2/ATP-dependent DNA helicase PcrA